MTKEDITKVIRQCMKNAAGTVKVTSKTPISVLSGGSNAVRICLNGSFELEGTKALTVADVVESDTLASLTIKVSNKLLPAAKALAFAKAAFDPRPVVHQCIDNAARPRPFGKGTKLKNIPADPDGVRICINGSIPLTGNQALRKDEVTGEDSENSLTIKTRNKMS